MSGNRAWGGSSAPDLSSGGSGSGTNKRTAKRRMSNDPEVVQVITKDLIRKIRYVQSINAHLVITIILLYTCTCTILVE